MLTHRKLRLSEIAALALMVFAFGASALISRNVFERLPHLEDEFAYLYQARIFERGQAWVPRNEPVKVFWQPFVLQPETSPDGTYRRFGKYPPGWPLVLTVGLWLGQPWLVNAVLAMLNVGLVYRLGREIFDETVGVVAALFLAISPMALLLNATLMAHTWTMFAAIVFVYAYWRITRHGRGRYVWAVIGGLMLGGVVTTRPMTAVAMALPVFLHGLSRLYDAAFQPETAVGRVGLMPTLKVLVVMAAFVLPTALLWPLFNHIWTGDWNTNTYTLLWSYDKVGFGPGYGLNPGGHSLNYGWRNARNDLREWLRDLFGFTMHPALEAYMRVNFIYGAGVGLSWLPVVAGLIAGRKRDWIWFFFMFFVVTVLAGLTYWIGAVVNGAAAYSVRYYFEATFAVCLVAAYGAVAWARSLKAGRTPASLPGTFPNRLKAAWNGIWPGYFLILVACGLSVAGYTPARFREPLPPRWRDGLYRYNKVGQNQLAAIQAIRGDDPRPALIIVLNSPRPGVQDNWRDYAAALAMTSPYLDSDIIVARVFEPEDAPEFERRFSDRKVLYQIGENLYTSIEDALAQARTSE